MDDYTQSTKQKQVLPNKFREPAPLSPFSPSSEITIYGKSMQSLEIIAYDPIRKIFSASVYSSISANTLAYQWDIQGNTVRHAGPGATCTGIFSDDSALLSGGWRPGEEVESNAGNTYDATMIRVKEPE